MYIEITVDLKHYTGETFDLRLSNYHSIKKVIDIVWQAKRIPELPREGCWVRVTNKRTVFSGVYQLAACGITTGDRIEIL
ncbi:putative ubiquitin-like protein YukD [Scopulibacillus darangshiensis]|uniref:Putative ubiquitin-like protein YukD n=1 Tax=Scopulibacillus darangshiensis TaxID=442528 RepID=A0A4R2PAB4_9BACL|nr:EsaB/YukD family protein [Scopulibacillus darangshiensis]TCP31204.1 putative ubiquitin-like protein YukD [Scopulibacillus darangshiensis]